MIFHQKISFKSALEIFTPVSKHLRRALNNLYLRKQNQNAYLSQLLDKSDVKVAYGKTNKLKLEFCKNVKHHLTYFYLNSHHYKFHSFL